MRSTALVALAALVPIAGAPSFAADDQESEVKPAGMAASAGATTGQPPAAGVQGQRPECGYGPIVVRIETTPLPYPVRLGRKPIAIAMMASIVTTRIAGANSSISFAIAQSPDGWHLGPSVHLDRSAPCIKAVCWAALPSRCTANPAQRGHRPPFSWRFGQLRLGTARSGRIGKSIGCIRTDKSALP